MGVSPVACALLCDGRHQLALKKSVSASWQVAYLNAKLFNTRRIYFVGNFLRHNHLAEMQLAFAIDYWSSGEMEALFLEHEGYLGALGAFLMSGTEEATEDANDD